MKTNFSLLGLLSFTVVWTLTSGRYQETELTFLLPAGSAQCFYQTTARNNNLEIMYRVTAGSGLDVGFAIFSPSGSKVASDFRGSDNFHVIDAAEEGDYRFCFDNTFSKFSVKMFFFRVVVTDQGAAEDWMDQVLEEHGSDQELDIRGTMDSIHRNLERSRQALIQLRAFEKIDLGLLEDNLWRVSFWSCVNLLVMMGVASAQVYTVRHLFKDTKRVW